MDFQQCGHKTLKDQRDIILWSDFFIPNVPEGTATETESGPEGQPGLKQIIPSSL